MAGILQTCRPQSRAGVGQEDSQPGLETGVEGGQHQTNSFTLSGMPARDLSLSPASPPFLIIRDLLYNLEGMLKKRKLADVVYEDTAFSSVLRLPARK